MENKFESYLKIMNNHSRHKTIANASLGNKVTWLRGVELQFLSQVTHINTQIVPQRRGQGEVYRMNHSWFQHFQRAARHFFQRQPLFILIKATTGRRWLSPAVLRRKPVAASVSCKLAGDVRCSGAGAAGLHLRFSAGRYYGYTE